MSCPGDCCAVFRLPHTRGELRRRGPRELHQADQIADMLVPLTPREARLRSARLQTVTDAAPSFPWSDRGHHFTCRNWDEETRLCGIYEDRPDMCRHYPYGRECEHGCDCRGESWPAPVAASPPAGEVASEATGAPDLHEEESMRIADGHGLRKARHVFGLTQRQVAAAAGLSTSRVSMVERANVALGENLRATVERLGFLGSGLPNAALRRARAVHAERGPYKRPAGAF